MYCITLCTTYEYNTAYYSSDIFPLILQTIITAEMQSNRGK